MLGEIKAKGLVLREDPRRLEALRVVDEVGLTEE